MAEVARTSALPLSVGFVGIGAMGRPMAARILQAGNRVRVYDKDTVRAEDLAAEAGCEAVASPADLGPGSDIVITMLPNSGIVEDVLFGSGALAAAMRKDSLLVEMSSGAPQQTIALGERLSKRGVAMIDAPVSGGVARAVTGQLAVMVGGDPALVERARPLLETMGSTITHVGGLGAAHAMKALNNLVSAAGFLIGIEALLIGKKFGLDPAVMTDVLNASSGMNNSTKTKFRQFVLSRSFASGFSADLMVKDLRTALTLAHEIGVSAPFAEECRALWDSGVAFLGSGADHTAIARACENIAGVSLEPEQSPAARQG
jgi:3-hydroxyisobutyrate dehydrogenase